MSDGKPIAITAGLVHTCALLAKGTVECWGSNGRQMLGAEKSLESSAKPLPVKGIDRVSAIASGDGHTCALRADGTVWCWGLNDYGQLGAKTTDDESGTPVQVTGLANVTAIGGGVGFSCAVLDDGTVKCWGDNLNGELGTGSTEDWTYQPVTINGIAGATAVSGGQHHACARLESGSVMCWGSQNSGILGNGSIEPVELARTPVAVANMGAAKTVSRARFHGCALLVARSVACWGGSGSGEAGNGAFGAVPTPVIVSGLTGVSDISAGGRFTCAVISPGGTVKCWGSNLHGELGSGTPDEGSPTPVGVLGLSDVKAVASGERHACVLLTDGTVKCWGDNFDGVLGNPSLTFGQISGPLDVVGL